MIAEYFAEHFSRICTNSTGTRAAELKSDYENSRVNYSGWPDLDEHKFDACLVEGAINSMCRGKAAGLDTITSEHLQNCHALLPCVLSRLFNLMVTASHIPDAFCKSYTVPLLKGNCSTYCKTVSANDFRGISISPVLPKVFEHCILRRYCDFLN